MSDLKLAESVASRGNNLVFLAPPAPSGARPLLAGVLARREQAGAGLWLGLAPPEAIEEWARVGAEVSRGSGFRVAGAHTPARLARLLGSQDLALVFTSPDTAHELVRRAALKLDTLTGILLIWPEAWGGEEPATVLLQDVSKDAQRILLTADPVASAPLIERYCWRAATADLLGPAPVDTAPRVRTMTAPWSGRREALLDLVEQLDPESLAVYLRDEADRESIERALEAAGISATIGTELLPAASLIVAYELPSPAQLRKLAGAGELVLLVPPGTEGYVARIAPDRRPLHALGSLHAAQARLTRARRSIVETVERGPAPASFATLAPLLERHEATAIAAALYELWEQARAEPTAQASPVRPPIASVQLWVGIGKRDAVTPHDLVAAMLKDCGVPKEAIGKVEIRESFSMIQLGTAVDAEQVAEQLTGKVIRKRRLIARVDRGRPQKARGGG